MADDCPVCRPERAIVASDSAWHTQLNGRKKQFGKDQEPLGEFVGRMRIHYTSFYEELKQEASRIATD